MEEVAFAWLYITCSGYYQVDKRLRMTFDGAKLASTYFILQANEMEA